LHILKTDLLKVLNEIFSTEEEWAGNSDYKFKVGGPADCTSLVNQIMLKSTKYAITTRSLLESNGKIARKTKQIKSSTHSDAMLFAETLYHVRVKMRHRGIQRIKVGSKDWLIVKECAAAATEFCLDFGLQPSKGFQRYIEIGMAKMNRYHLVKLSSMYPGICETYEAQEVIHQDSHPPLTELAHKTYRNLVFEHTNMDFDYSKMPEKYVWFVKAVQEANKLTMSPDTYIRAQFDGMKFRNGIPDPAQLVGDKAVERVKNYLYENNMQLKIQAVGVNFKALKKMR
jgi:hypothetical protein